MSKVFVKAIESERAYYSLISPQLLHGSKESCCRFCSRLVFRNTYQRVQHSFASCGHATSYSWPLPVLNNDQRVPEIVQCFTFSVLFDFAGFVSQIVFVFITMRIYNNGFIRRKASHCYKLLQIHSLEFKKIPSDNPFQ